MSLFLLAGQDYVNNVIVIADAIKRIQRITLIDFTSNRPATITVDFLRPLRRNVHYRIRLNPREVPENSSVCVTLISDQGSLVMDMVQEDVPLETKELHEVITDPYFKALYDTSQLCKNLAFSAYRQTTGEIFPYDKKVIFTRFHQRLTSEVFEIYRTGSLPTNVSLPWVLSGRNFTVRVLLPSETSFCSRTSVILPKSKFK